MEYNLGTGQLDINCIPRRQPVDYLFLILDQSSRGKDAKLFNSNFRKECRVAAYDLRPCEFLIKSQQFDSIGL